MKLTDTIDLMESDSHIDRLAAEYLQLRNRLEGLEKMLNLYDAGELSFEPTCPIETLQNQLKSMGSYLIDLEDRLYCELGENWKDQLPTFEDIDIDEEIGIDTMNMFMSAYSVDIRFTDFIPYETKVYKKEDDVYTAMLDVSRVISHKDCTVLHANTSSNKQRSYVCTNNEEPIWELYEGKVIYDPYDTKSLVQYSDTMFWRYTDSKPEMGIFMDQEIIYMNDELIRIYHDEKHFIIDDNSGDVILIDILRTDEDERIESVDKIYTVGANDDILAIIYNDDQFMLIFDIISGNPISIAGDDIINAFRISTNEVTDIISIDYLDDIQGSFLRICDIECIIDLNFAINDNLLIPIKHKITSRVYNNANMSDYEDMLFAIIEGEMKLFEAFITTMNKSEDELKSMGNDSDEKLVSFEGMIEDEIADFKDKSMLNYYRDLNERGLATDDDLVELNRLECEEDIRLQEVADLQAYDKTDIEE